jgi:hypothetical protein
MWSGATQLQLRCWHVPPLAAASSTLQKIAVSQSCQAVSPGGQQDMSPAGMQAVTLRSNMTERSMRSPLLCCADHAAHQNSPCHATQHPASVHNTPQCSHSSCHNIPAGNPGLARCTFSLTCAMTRAHHVTGKLTTLHPVLLSWPV